MAELTVSSFTRLIEEASTKSFGVSASELSVKEMYSCVATVVKDLLLARRKVFNKQYKSEGKKRVYYLSMEFLMGRSLKNNLFNMNLTEVATAALKKYDLTPEQLYEQEPDAGLGNGGLGRLAACYLDALAGKGYPAMGHSLRFEYGLFRQKIVDGWQTEIPDNWLPGGQVWLKERPDKATIVRFGGEVKETWTESGAVHEIENCEEVEAFPYDMVVSGYGKNAVAVLRLWSARNNKKFDIHAFDQGEYMRAVEQQAQAELITKVLYPNDNHQEGKALRLKQEYFLVSAAMQNITTDHFRRYGNFDDFANCVAIHINDTHPALCVPELMRIFVDDYRLPWEYAWQRVTDCCAYTNHTVLAEALECWPDYVLKKLIPRVYDIIVEINERACNAYWDKCHDFGTVSNLAAVAYGQVRMANLAVIGSHSVNGVSELHSNIIKKSLFSDYYRLEPEKFTNVTNGIAYRRWLCQSNPRLTSLIKELIGDKFLTDADQLKKLNSFAGDKAVLDRLAEIKLANKRDFAQFAFEKSGIQIDPETRFDVQVKRLHEYKRQLLNVLKIIALYHDLKENPDLPVTPQTFIFGAKAAPGYYRAKEVIKLVCMLQKELESRPDVRKKLNVVFMENYCVTMAEKLMPASEVSEQISLAGKEASGTGNMKFMINGAVTLGTLDGANVEIREAVGDDNMFVFGLTAEEVHNLWAKGYNSTEYYFRSPTLRTVIDELNAGFAGVSFESISSYLLHSANVADPYMCFADFASYVAAAGRLDEAYKDKYRWNAMALRNIAESGRFSADRAVEEYAENIWKMND